MSQIWADKAIEDMKASYEAELSTLRDRIEELEMQLVLSKPLYSRRQLEARIAKLEKALEPFADAVYNDNGDIEVNLSVDADDLINAYFVLRRAVLDQDKGGSAACGQTVDKPS